MEKSTMLRRLMLLVATIIVQVDGQLEGDVRLIGGSSSLEGRVEIFHISAWGTVCDDFWDLADADVVCRQLGFPYVLEAKEEAYFGEGSSDMEIWLSVVGCTGSEFELSDCRHPGWGVASCSHSEDAGVVCYNSSDGLLEGDVRLIGGSSSLEGRIEIFHMGIWGTVCDTWWDIADADVVCRQLGFVIAQEATTDAHFGGGSSNKPIWLDQVQCSGLESELRYCLNSGWNVTDCTHSEDAGVVCTNSSGGELEGEVRLIGGSSSLEGRVEIFHMGVWGTVCDNGWDIPDADVVCRQLGFPSALEAKGSAYFGLGSMHIWLAFVDCTGTESELSNCSHPGWGISYCTHSDDAGVVCFNSSDGLLEGDVRLIGGSSSLEGRVEIFHTGLWGTVCDDYWDFAGADVVCRQLGFTSALEAKKNAYFGQGSSHMEIWLSRVNCSGSESELSNCSHSGWGIGNCTHGEDAGAVCYYSPDGQSEGDVRLIGGSSSLEGRVDIFHNGLWGTVCDDYWGLADADVVCRQLGLSSALEVKKNAYFGQGSSHMEIWLSRVDCSGSESELSNCSHSGWGVGNCTHWEDAGVVCSYSLDGQKEGEVRLIGGSSSLSGRVEIFHAGLWGTVCDDYWDLADADVVCRQLGFASASEAKEEAYFGEGSSDMYIWLDDVDCTGSESDLRYCSHPGWNVGNCWHWDDAGVVCSYSAASEGDVRLVDGHYLYEGRLEIYHNYQWGTICDDVWGYEEAKVVCLQLGYEGVDSPQSNIYGPGQDPIHLYNVQCSGYESSLLQCSHSYSGNCAHNQDVGLICASYTSGTEQHRALTWWAISLIVLGSLFAFGLMVAICACCCYTSQKKGTAAVATVCTTSSNTSTTQNGVPMRPYVQQMPGTSNPEFATIGTTYEPMGSAAYTATAGAVYLPTAGAAYPTTLAGAAGSEPSSEAPTQAYSPPPQYSEKDSMP